MFLPVSCSACGKPFQVPEATVGKPTICPWCQATVAALPVGQPAPAATAEPLPLDDEPPPVPLPAARLVAPATRRLWVRVALSLLIVSLIIAAAAATFAVLRYKQGLFIAPEWHTFTAPDGSCSADLFGHPREENDAGLKLFVSEGWYSGTKAWVGWRDLTQAQIQQAAGKDGWVNLKPLFAAERDRLRAQYGGSITREATRAEPPLSHEVRLEWADGRAIERMIVKPDGPRPRIYFVGIAGKNLNLESYVVARLFESFRIHD
jgi:hypothetical protein